MLIPSCFLLSFAFMSVSCSHSDSPMYLSLCSFMSFVFSALPSGISFLPHEINIRNLLIFLDGHSVLNCVYLILFSKKKNFTGYKFWVRKYFSCNLLKISCHSLWFSCCPASNSMDVIGLFLWHLLRFSLPSICSFTVCLVWISFYLIHLEIYKLLNLWIGIFHHSGKSSVIVSIFGISAPILPLLVEYLLVINRC